ncbi:MAG: hypothetical protein AAF250_11675 [Pseudomonadota bacterium]
MIQKRIPHLVRSFRSLFAANDRYGDSPIRGLSKAHERATQNTRYFYLAAALYVWMCLPQWHQAVIGAPPLEHVWPLYWAADIPILPLMDTLGVISATLAILAFWKPDVILFRIGFTLSFLFCASVSASLGAINHGHHEWIWVSLVFIFLPSGTTRVAKLSYCLTFATAQALVLMFYTMAGFWKFAEGIKSLINGVPGNFSPDALAWTLADRMAQTNTSPLLGPFFVDYAILAWPLFLCLMYVQIVSIVIAFRPSMHLVWAGILVAFHTGTFLLMEIAFPTHIVILMLLLIASPFQREDWLRPQTLTLLPLFGGLFAYLLSLFARPILPPRENAQCAI